MLTRWWDEHALCLKQPAAMYLSCNNQHMNKMKSKRKNEEKKNKMMQSKPNPFSILSFVYSFAPIFFVSSSLRYFTVSSSSLPFLIWWKEGKFSSFNLSINIYYALVRTVMFTSSDIFFLSFLSHIQYQLLISIFNTANG